MSRPDWLPTTHVEVGLHVFETTRYSPRLYPEQDRATVRIDGVDAHVTVFGHHGDLVRLRDVIGEVIAQLDAARAASRATASSETSTSTAA
jgi:hypothetical protein